MKNKINIYILFLLSFFIILFVTKNILNKTTDKDIQKISEYFNIPIYDYEVENRSDYILTLKLSDKNSNDIKFITSYSSTFHHYNKEVGYDNYEDEKLYHDFYLEFEGFDDAKTGYIDNNKEKYFSLYDKDMKRISDVFVDNFIFIIYYPSNNKLYIYR